MTLVSTYVSDKPLTSIKRYDKNSKAKVDIPCPNIVRQYNTHMGGVDLMDMLISLYRIPLKTRRWYLSIFAQMLDLCLNNAWLLYRRDHDLLSEVEGEKQLALKEFRYYIAKSLKMKERLQRKRPFIDIKATKKIKSPVVLRPPTDVSTDKIDHFPIYTTKGRCRICTTGKTNWQCSKCNMRLCLVKNRNCFYIFHNNQ